MQQCLKGTTQCWESETQLPLTWPVFHLTQTHCSNVWLQSISPGVVQTEFALRLHSHNPEKAASFYTKIKVTISLLWQVSSRNVSNIKENFSWIKNLFQPLEAIDLANSVVYVLSAPPHVQVCCLPSLCAHSDLCCWDSPRLLSNSAFCCWAQALIAQWGNLINSSPSDWRHPHATCGTGVLMWPLWKARFCFFYRVIFQLQE